jgi:predicted PurR-regulated permease PerM
VKRVDRARLAWWLVVGGLFAGVSLVVYAFVGTLSFGIFVYYASRPVYRTIREWIHSDELAAALTIFGSTGPILALVAYVFVTALLDLVSFLQLGPNQVSSLLSPLIPWDAIPSRARRFLQSVPRDPLTVQQFDRDLAQNLLRSSVRILQVAATGALHFVLAFMLGFYLLRDDDKIASWFRTTIGEPESTAFAYVTAVDRDLETVYFGNVLFIVAVGVTAGFVYVGFNLAAPDVLSIPFPMMLALLTGVASLIPIVVGKVVYVPVVVYVAFRAIQTGRGGVHYPLGLLVVSFLILDILPQTFLQPYLSGRKIHVGLLLFAYVLGPLLVGWYGIFLFPLFLVLVLQAVRIVLPELIHGERLTSSATGAPSLGSSPRSSSSEEEPPE